MAWYIWYQGCHSPCGIYDIRMLRRSQVIGVFSSVNQGNISEVLLKISKGISLRQRCNGDGHERCEERVEEDTRI